MSPLGISDLLKRVGSRSSGIYVYHVPVMLLCRLAHFAYARQADAMTADFPGASECSTALREVTAGSHD